MGNDGEEGSPGAEEEEQEGEPGRCHEGGIPSPQGWPHVKEFIIIHIYDVECDDYLRLAALDTQVGVQEAHVASGVALTSVLHSLSIHSLQQKTGVALDVLALHGIRVMLGADHTDLTALVANGDSALFRKLGELWLGGLAVATPVCVVHGESVHCRGTSATLETLEQATVEVDSHGIHGDK